MQLVSPFLGWYFYSWESGISQKHSRDSRELTIYPLLSATYENKRHNILTNTLFNLIVPTLGHVQQYGLGIQTTIRAPKINHRRHQPFSLE